MRTFRGTGNGPRVRGGGLQGDGGASLVPSHHPSSSLPHTLMDPTLNEPSKALALWLSRQFKVFLHRESVIIAIAIVTASFVFCFASPFSSAPCRAPVKHLRLAWDRSYDGTDMFLACSCQGQRVCPTRSKSRMCLALGSSCGVSCSQSDNLSRGHMVKGGRP